MKILIAPDKFKGSLSAQEVCMALTKGIKKSNPEVVIFSRPLADGGDGSLVVLAHYFDLETHTVQVQDPLGRPIRAAYKIANQTAYIEMAAASGLVLLQAEERNCMLTSTFGTGQLIADAVAKGVQEIYLFIGGSATNDGGIGMANALGYQFYDADGKLLRPIGKSLLQIEKIDDSQFIFNKKEVAVKVVCDVSNPLFGPNGAAYIYAAQKGANASEIAQLDKGLMNLANQLIAHQFPAIADKPGAGAAGGIGGGAMAFLGATLMSGIDTFLEISDVENILKECDLVITGEGKLDQQTEQGKVISGIAALALKYNIPVIAVCGAADLPLSDKLNIQQVYTVLSRSKSVAEAMTKAAEKLAAIGAILLNK